MYIRQNPVLDDVFGYFWDWKIELVNKQGQRTSFVFNKQNKPKIDSVASKLEQSINNVGRALRLKGRYDDLHRLEEFVEKEGLIVSF